METNNDQSYVNNHNVQQKYEWPSIESQSTVHVSSVIDAHQSSEYYTNSSTFAEASRQLKNHEDEYVAEDGPVENENHDIVGTASIPTKIISDDSLGGASTFNNSWYEDLNSYQSRRHPSDDNKGEIDISSVAPTLEQLKIHTDDQGTEPDNSTYSKSSTAPYSSLYVGTHAPRPYKAENASTLIKVPTIMYMIKPKAP